ncbi:hypothetical protein AwDysgo_04390 [Bacteroidales bacterium]|nr:hypothetical protein AwDysgo_04390 [Bacteroidales bacterium]
MKKIYKYIALIVTPLCLMITACDEDLPKNVESNDFTILESISIVNAGLNGDSTVMGKVDEIAKKVSFPSLKEGTVLDKMRFEVKLSQGAQMDAETYDFTMNEGDRKKSRILTVSNGKRYREYMATISYPQFGADFSPQNSRIFDYSSNPLGQDMYPDFGAMSTRSAAFDGEHALIVSRLAESSLHLLKLEDIIANKAAPNKINLDRTGIAGGTYTISSGALAHKHIYVCNLTTAFATSPLKLYHWESPSATPQLILEVKALEGAGARYGDNMSVNIDEKGNGYIFFGDLASTRMLRFEVANFTEVSATPKIISLQASAPEKDLGAWMTYNQVPGTSNYLNTSYASPIMLVDADKNVIYTMKATAGIPLQCVDARILEFNNERYLLATTARRAEPNPFPTVYIYNISNGETIQDALENLDNRETIEPVFSFSLNGLNNGAPGTNTGWAIVDSKLYVFGSSANAGFAVFEFPENAD